MNHVDHRKNIMSMVLSQLSLPSICHSREGGNPFRASVLAGEWIP
jgi:hypothetical protein